MNTTTKSSSRNKSDPLLTPEIIKTLNYRLKNKGKGIPAEKVESMLREEMAKYK